MNVVITGASRGIGLELARQYAQAGDRVFAFARSPETAAGLSALAAQSSGRVSAHPMDVADGASIEAGARALEGAPVDVLINNAGVIGGRPQTLEEIDFDAWIEAFRIMTFGPFRVARALLPNLEAASDPKIVTITSQLGASTWPMGGSYAYASAKAAVNKVMQTMAIDLKDRRIAVGLIHPGWVKTDMGGPQAQITPEESAAGIRAVIAGLDLSGSGRFFKWNGEPHPW